jgi:hypothetical protein
MIWTGAALMAALSAGDAIGTVTFTAGKTASAETPVEFPWPTAWPDGVMLSSGAEGKRPVQKLERNGSSVGVCIAPPLAAGGTATWNAVPSSEATGGITLAKYEDGVAVKIDGKPFTNFVTRRTRKPILWPILGPNGERMTQTGPKDHIHHRSFWFTHGHVNGHDFWSELPRAGRTVVSNLQPVVSGPVFGDIDCTVDWNSKDGVKVCSDERRMRFYKTATARVIDFEIAFKPQTGDLVFGDDKEGTFGVRVAETMSADQPKDKPKGGTLVNAEGLQNGAVWGKKSPWCDYSGPVDGGVAGIAILDHPSNLRHPTTWHARTYGLFCANPFGLSFFTNKKENGEHRVPNGQEFRLRYRVVLHPGDAAAADVPGHFAAYANPPSVMVR